MDSENLLLSPNCVGKKTMTRTANYFTSPSPGKIRKGRGSKRQNELSLFMSPNNEVCDQRNKRKKAKEVLRREGGCGLDLQGMRLTTYDMSNSIQNALLSDDMLPNLASKRIIEIVGPDEDRIGFTCDSEWSITYLVREFIRSNYPSFDTKEAHLTHAGENVIDSLPVSSLDFDSSYRLVISVAEPGI